MTKWSQEQAALHERPNMTEEETRRTTEIAERMGRCMTNVFSGSASGSATP